jgi:hypothetical protein
MLIIVDKRLPDPAKQTLKRYGEVIDFHTSGITYEAISGHPDIFFFQNEKELLVSKNLPKEYLQILEYYSVIYSFSEKPIGQVYPETAALNAFTTNDFILHNPQISDPAILENNKPLIKVNQGYCRCNCINLKNKIIITSDPGIYQSLQFHQINSCYINPEDILLPGFKHGFIGGAAGWYSDKLFVAGSLNRLSEGRTIHDQCNNYEIEIIELYKGPLFDGGGILFFEL